MVQDLADIGQDVTLWYMSRPDHDFDVRKFFADTIPVDEEDDESGLKDVSNLADVISCVRKKEYRKRAVSCMRWRVEVRGTGACVAQLTSALFVWLGTSVCTNPVEAGGGCGAGSWCVQLDLPREEALRCPA